MPQFLAYLPWPAWLPLAALLVQLYYAVRYFWPFATRPAEAGFDAPGPAAAPLSILVCARNELDNLRELLPLLLQQQHPADLEIVLIDDRSRDDTYLYAQQLAQYYPTRFRLVTVAHTPANFAPKKYALTLGIKAARHEHLLFTDADCRPASPHWATLMQRGFAAGPAAGPLYLVLGASFPAVGPGLLNRLVRYETLLTAAQYLGFAGRGRPYMGVGRNLAYTRATFRATKGFARHIRRLSGDDDLLVQDAVQHGATAVVVADPPAQTTTQAPASWAAWWRQKRRHLSAGTQYRPADRARIGIFMAANDLFYVGAGVGAWFPQAWVSLIIICTARTFLTTAVYVKVARRLGQPFPLLWLPLLDFAYFIQFLFLGLSLSINRRLRWK